MTLFFSTKENTECQLHDIAIKIGKKKKSPMRTPDQILTK